MLEPQTALILGATGVVGKLLLKELLNSPRFTRVGEFGRHMTALDTEGLNHKEKLIQKQIDFEKPAEAGFTEEKWDVIFITMGTTRKRAGSVEAFYKIDQEYVVEAARAAKRTDHKQRVVYLSSGGANPTSYFTYMKSKGQTEERLASLGYSDTIILRPGKFFGKPRDDIRELVSQSLIYPLSVFSDHLSIDVKQLAKSMRIVGELGSSALPPLAETTILGGSNGIPKFTMVPNKGCIQLSQTQ